MSNKQIILVIPVVVVLAASVTICFALALYAPSPWNKWGATVALIMIASLNVQRAIQTTTKKPAFRWTPYIVAAYTFLVPFIIFASGMLQIVSFIVFSITVIIAGIFWIIGNIIDETKKLFKRSSLDK